MMACGFVQCVWSARVCGVRGAFVRSFLINPFAVHLPNGMIYHVNPQTARHTSLHIVHVSMTNSTGCVILRRFRIGRKKTRTET